MANQVRLLKQVRQANDRAETGLKARLVALRLEYPDAQIKTSLVRHTVGLAIFRAIIRLPEGAIATGWGAANRTEDLSYLEIAENKALTRAFDLLGFYAQYTEQDEPSEEDLQYVPEEAAFAIIAETPPEYVPEPEPVPEPETPPEYVPEPARPEPETVPKPKPEPPVARPNGTSSIEQRPVIEKRALDEAISTLKELNKQPPTTAPAPQIGIPTVDERLKAVSDESLRLWIKQIYHEARIRNFNEDVVDKQSRKRYNVPAYELNVEQAKEFVERIRQARKTS